MVQHQRRVAGTERDVEITPKAHSLRGTGEFAALVDRDPAVARAVELLGRHGVSTGTRSKKISTRVDPGIMEAAKQRFGLTSDADVINASLALAAAPDRFKIWLESSTGTVSDDFELAV